MSYLGLDIGTSGCKAVVFEADGSMLASAYLGYEVSNPEPGFAELDSNEVMEKCFSVIKSAVAQSPGSAVAGLCISSQGEAFTPVGEGGAIIGNAMVSSDCRAAGLVEAWSRDFGREKLYQITGHTAYSMFSLFKLLWLKEHDPQLWGKARGFHCFEDLMHLRLGLEPAISWPLAGRTMLFDVTSHCWSPEILEAVGLSSSQLARPLPTGGCVGEIPRQIAAELGLGEGVKVYAGGHDQTVGALGAGVVEEGSAMYATGTVECICPVFSAPHTSRELCENNLCCYDFTLPGKYTTVAYSLTGGNILQWFKNEFAQQEIAEAKQTGGNVYDNLIAQMDDEPTGLLVLPYFTPTGTPYFDTTTKGAILGLQMTTTRVQILRALLEGVVLEMRLNLDIMERSGMGIDTFIATGGGARNHAWMQLKANVLNKPITATQVDEAGCFGAAMIACAADTGAPLADLVDLKNRPRMEIEPKRGEVEIYDEKFATYKKLYGALKPLDI